MRVILFSHSLFSARPLSNGGSVADLCKYNLGGGHKDRITIWIEESYQQGASLFFVPKHNSNYGSASTPDINIPRRKNEER